MRFVNPSFGLAAAVGEKTASGPIDWRRDSIALFTNAKPNARELLEGMRRDLARLRPVDNVEFVGKNSASQPAPPELIERVARDYKIALLALAD